MYVINIFKGNNEVHEQVKLEGDDKVYSKYQTKKDPYLSAFLHFSLGFRCLGKDAGEGDEGVNFEGTGTGDLECDQLLAEKELVE